MDKGTKPKSQSKVIDAMLLALITTMLSACSVFFKPAHASLPDNWYWGVIKFLFCPLLYALPLIEPLVADLSRYPALFVFVVLNYSLLTLMWYLVLRLFQAMKRNR
jgi:hypothetical protein